MLTVPVAQLVAVVAAMVPSAVVAVMMMVVRVGTGGKRCKHWYSSCICRSMGTRELHTNSHTDQAEVAVEVVSPCMDAMAENARVVAATAVGAVQAMAATAAAASAVARAAKALMALVLKAALVAML